MQKPTNVSINTGAGARNCRENPWTRHSDANKIAVMQRAPRQCVLLVVLSDAAIDVIDRRLCQQQHGVAVGEGCGGVNKIVVRVHTLWVQQTLMALDRDDRNELNRAFKKLSEPPVDVRGKAAGVDNIAPHLH